MSEQTKSQAPAVAIPAGGEQTMTLRELKKAAKGWSNQEKKKQVRNYYWHRIEQYQKAVDKKNYSDNAESDEYGFDLRDRLNELEWMNFPFTCYYYFEHMHDWVKHRDKPRDNFMEQVFHEIDFTV